MPGWLVDSFWRDSNDPQEAQRTGRFLRGILLFGILSSVISTGGLLLVSGFIASTLAFNSALFAGLVIIWLVARGGKIRLASLLLGLLFWAYLSLALYSFGGIQNTIVSLFIILVLIAGTLLGQPGVLLVTALSTFSTLVIVLLEMNNSLPASPPISPLGQWITFVSILLGGAAVMYLWYGNVREAIANAKYELTERQRIEAELRTSEERYRLISAVMSDYSFATRVDPDGSAELEWVAGAFESISGYTFDEFKQTGGWQAHIHPDDFEADTQAMEILHSNQKVWHEIRVLHKNGDVVWVRSYALPLWDEKNNRLKGIYGGVQNITVEKQAKEREFLRREMLEKVIDLGKTVTGIVDLQECLQAIHRSVQKGLGFDRVGLFLYDAENNTVHGMFGTNRDGTMEDISSFSQSVAESSTWIMALQSPKGVVLTDDYQREHPSGPESEMFGVKQHVTLAAWAGETPVGLITVDNVISGQVIREERLDALQLFAGYAGLAIHNAQLNAGLEARVHARTAELEDAVNELQQFSYAVSHDLRAPLRGIHGYVSILLSEFGAEFKPQVKEYLGRVSANARMMGELVDDLLAFLHLNRVSLQKRPVNLSTLAKNVFATLHKLEPAERQIELICAESLTCAGDYELLKQALNDLFSNAIKFTRTRPVAKIEFGSLNKDDETVYFIRDNGIGFDMRYYSKLFGVFQRLHHPEASSELEGTGVGLAIVQRIIQKHGGSVWAESEPDKGATFFFTL